MSDLTEFLLARVAEDEAEASCWAVWRMNPERGVPAYQAIRERVLAECEAKRRIVALHSLEPDDAADDYWLGNCRRCDSSGPEAQGYPCDTLRALALPYADHPDYREAWRP